MADNVLDVLRAATCECAATARLFSPERSAEAVTLANVLLALFLKSTTAAATAKLRVVEGRAARAPLLPHLPTELIVEVLQHLDVRSLGRPACTCRQLYFTVAVGWNRSFFVDANGALLACGKEGPGEMGMGMLGLREGTSKTPFTAAVPTPVPSMTGVRVQAVVCLDNGNLAVSEAGQVFAWECNVQPSVEHNIGWSKCKWQPPVPTVMEELRDHRVRQICAGCDHFAALTEDGALFTWETERDLNNTGDPIAELGRGNFVHDARAPYCVFGLDGV
jgi:alpha-tubulin suppressor-like RCC1 family protein